jgi:ABC-type multidrug transport system ATPase subunit
MITSEPARTLESVEAPIPASSRLAASTLELVNIHRSWGSRKVLAGASLTVPRATVVWLGGRNGAGKTTLLRIAAGILLPDRGSISLDGLDPERDRRAYHARIGFLPAGDRGMYARLTVRQNVELAARLAQVRRRDRAQLIERSLARFELNELAKRRVDRLSMGQRQRVRLAMTLVHEPELVLLDEPNTSLDDPALELLEAALFECTLRGGSVLWASPASKSLPLPANLRYHMAEGTLSLV